jgi:hypothetical protein
VVVNDAGADTGTRPLQQLVEVQLHGRHGKCKLVVVQHLRVDATKVAHTHGARAAACSTSTSTSTCATPQTITEKPVRGRESTGR